MKICADCKESKQDREFHKKSSAKDGLQTRCKTCNNKKVRQWQSDNPEAFEVNWRRNSYGEHRSLIKRARLYGITKEELKELLLNANGICDICKRPPTRWLVVDHCHKTKKVRGILCEQCNTALGLFADNPEFLQSAINYLSN